MGLRPTPTERRSTLTRRRAVVAARLGSRQGLRQMRFGPRWAFPVACAPLLALAFFPRASSAQITLWESDAGSLELAGYVQTLSGTLRGAGLLDQGWAGLHGGVGRLGWTARFGDRFVFEVHDRFLFQVGGGGGSGVSGLGVTVVPGRALDLESTLVEGDDVRLWHDLDRLAVTLYSGGVDVTVGRQAISWGNANLFPVADLWGRFSPFELDTQQKPGVDAVRALAYPVPGGELDMVVADAGEGEGVSAAANLTLTRGWGDVAVGAGKFWNQVMVLGGVTWVRATTNLRAEFAVPWELDDEDWALPRITLGVDGLGVRWSWSVEAHWSGIGTSDPDEYALQLQDEAFARGESYLLGRRYAGGFVSWSPDLENRVRLALGAQGNLNDGSVAWLPSASYDLGQTSRITLGGLLGSGNAPDEDPRVAAPLPVPRLRSEFGSYGRFGYLQLALFF